MVFGQIGQSSNVLEIILSGRKLEKTTNNLNLIEEVGLELFKENRDFIKAKVKDNWFVIIEPVSGTLMASADQLEVYNYGKVKFPDKIFYSVGLLKDNI